MKKRSLFSSLVIGLLVSGLFLVGSEKQGESALEAEDPQKTEELTPISNVIEIKAEGEILHYQKKSLWNEEDFSEILGSRNNFGSQEIDSFGKSLEKFSRYAVNPRVEFNEARKSTALICDIKGAKEGSWHDFDWFLRPRGLDLIDSHFEKKEKELRWEGKVEGVKTIVRIKFPYPISHCHEHVWPR